MHFTRFVKYDSLKDKNVAEFLVKGLMTEDAEHLMQAGLACKTEGGARLFPLVLRAWAAYHSSANNQTSLPWFVDNAYDADCVVQGGNEVLAEKVLQNVEAAKLLSYKLLQKDFTLKTFYRGGCCYKLPTMSCDALFFRGVRVVSEEERKDFDTEAELKAGSIVVFPAGEQGLEHIVPFQNVEKEYYFGGAQVKMVKNRPSKTLKNLCAAVKAHPDMNGDGSRFPVLYTTDAREDLEWKTYGVRFNCTGLEDFTKEFGPLRLTYEKKNSRKRKWGSSTSEQVVEVEVDVRGEEKHTD